jgi:hypothetical protein
MGNYCSTTVVVVEYIKDRWLTWRTGLDKPTRDYRKWYYETVAYRANTIENMFMNFKYILPVSVDIFDHSEPFGWVPCEDFEQYMYPARELGDNTVYYFGRGARDQYDGKFHLSDFMYVEDQVFAATNNDRDAVMIALKYSQWP